MDHGDCPVVSSKPSDPQQRSEYKWHKISVSCRPVLVKGGHFKPHIVVMLVVICATMCQL